MAKLDKVKRKVPFLESFYKSQIGSVLATATDMIVLVFCTEILLIYYVISAAIGAFCGAVISFYIGRNWAFRRKDGKLSSQAIRYFFTSASSLLLNVGGIYLLTDLIGLQYIISKIVISAIIGVFFNFFMFRYFVYK